MKKLIAVVIAAVLAGCNSPNSEISGTYVTKDSRSELTFINGKIRGPGLHGEVLETDFTVEGNTLKYKFPTGFPIVATINKDGSISMPYGSVFYKK